MSIKYRCMARKFAPHRQLNAENACIRSLKNTANCLRIFIYFCVSKIPKIFLPNYLNPKSIFKSLDPGKIFPSGSIETGVCPWGTFSRVHLSSDGGGHLSYLRLTNGIGP